MAKIPAGASLLFGALADSGRIRQRKNGSYKMVLKGVDQINWFTERPFRAEGTLKPRKLISKWDSFFETNPPNAQCSFKVGEEIDLITFEMFRPNLKQRENRISFKIDAEVVNDREADLVTGLKGKQLDDIALSIEDKGKTNSNPPAGESLLFGALADSGRIRQRRNGSYRLILKGVDQIDWFTGRPERVAGTWKPRRLLRKWDSYFANSEPNAQVTLKVDNTQEIVNFEMFKPKINNGKLIFNVRSLNEEGKDSLIDLKGKKLDDVSLLINDSSSDSWLPSACFPRCFEDIYEQIRTLAYITGYNNDETTQRPIQLLPLRPSSYRKAVAAYFWGLPLVEMRRSQLAILGKYDLDANDLYTPSDRNLGTSVVAPNLDVLNATGFIDFKEHSAFVLTVPDTRYENDTRGTFNVIQLLDAYTNVQGSFGTRQPDDDPAYDGHPINSGGNFLIYGPDFDGDIPADLADDIIQKYPVETNQAWLIGRMAVDAYSEPENTKESDYYQMIENPPGNLTISDGRELTYQYGVTPLEFFDPDGPTTPTKQDPEIGTPREPDPPWPEDAPENFPMFGDYMTGNDPVWTPDDFLTYLGESIDPDTMLDYIPPSPSAENNPSADSNSLYANRTIFEEFESIGLTVGQYQPPSHSLENVNEGVLAAAEFMGYLSDNLASLPADDGPYADSPWTVQTDLGRYSTDPDGWITAAVVSAVGMGANQAEDGIYPITNVDGDGALLKGQEHNYSLTFPAGELPPVLADDNGNLLGYWSVTVYDENGYIFKESAPLNYFYNDNVYSLGSMQLENLHDEDLINTPVTFYLQHDPPTNADDLPYWIPVPEDNFQVLMRIYYPDTDRFEAPLDSPSHYSLPNVEINTL